MEKSISHNTNYIGTQRSYHVHVNCYLSHWLKTDAFTADIQCNNLTTPTNGNISCSSGNDGVGYEGDTCNFTCNTGYEVTGSDARTCQSDGRWSGSDTMCRRGNHHIMINLCASLIIQLQCKCDITFLVCQ